MTFETQPDVNFYLYKPDTNHYAAFGVSSNVNVVSIYDSDAPLMGIIGPITVHGFDDNPPQVGDFPTLNNYSSLPIMSQRAWRVLEPLIGYCCEPLPLLSSSDQPYFIIHVMETIDCLDTSLSQVRRSAIDGRINKIFRYVFNESILNNKHIFKLPNESGGDLIVDGEFRRLVQDAGLVGLDLRSLPI